MTPLVPFVRSPDNGPNAALVDALCRAAPDLDVRVLGEIAPERLHEVTVAIADGPSEGQLARLPNLRLVQSTWAGVEAILPVLPAGVEVARMVDPRLAETMAEAVLAWTLHLHRDMPRYARQQRNGQWIVHELVHASHRRVGVLGLGVLGRAAVETLRDHGFDVTGWSRSPKSIDGVECFHDGLDGGGVDALLRRSDIVVNLLPHTEATTGLLGAAAFAQMPTGSSLINFGRGPTVDDEALLAALDDGTTSGASDTGSRVTGARLDRAHLEHAVLDVFVTEPLPEGHPYWSHPRVTVLPHVSGPTSAETAAVIAAANVRAFLVDGTLPADALVDRTRGY
ncbi:MAG: glyoxylate/hydroxypyruvate reductase A [Ilumatobacter sp.]|uniref:2-hydroxyacid dehydrogenase n=3 Tax=Ilumatobacter sp. TaxID=1967498 RepID=UPI00329714E5